MNRAIRIGSPYFYWVNLQEELARAHSRANADRVLEIILSEPSLTEEVVRLTVQSHDPVTVQRAAMVLGDLGRLRPEWLAPYLEKLVVAARHPTHPAVSRNVLRHLSELPPQRIPEALHARLLDWALVVTGAPDQPTACRVFAMQVAANLSGLYPEVAGELREVLAIGLEDATPGYRSRAGRILRSLPE